MRALLVVLAGCWTGSPAPMPPEAPQVQAAVVTAPKPKLKRPPPLQRSPAELAVALSHELRSQGPAFLPGVVDGPVVVLDLPTASFTTLCGTNAWTTAQGWGQLLADPTRTDPYCAPMPEAHFFCRQYAPASMSDPLLMLDFIHDDVGYRLISVMVGMPTPSHLTTLRLKSSELKSLVATATCP